MWKFGPIASLALFITAAVPQQSQAQGSRVSVLGCVSRGVEAGCLIITDNVSGKAYQINAAEPKPDPAKRLVVRLSGTIVNKISFCQQGPILEEIKWSYTKMRCRAPKDGAGKY
jgi:hypothetical protein